MITARLISWGITHCHNPKNQYTAQNPTTTKTNPQPTKSTKHVIRLTAKTRTHR
nr:MAG TPA: hypothetical protein [Caudoviricetes sp.]